MSSTCSEIFGQLGRPAGSLQDANMGGELRGAFPDASADTGFAGLRIRRPGSDGSGGLASSEAAKLMTSDGTKRGL